MSELQNLIEAARNYIYFNEETYHEDLQTVVRAYDAYERKKTELERIADLLKAAGADGIWLVRGAHEASLFYRVEFPFKYLALELEPPHERVLLVRFPDGDGEPGGIEQL